MWPLLYDGSGFQLGTYGVVVGAGILLCLWVARTLGKRDGLPPKQVNDLGIAVFVGGFVGAKALALAVSLMNGQSLGWTELRMAGAIHGGLLGGLATLFVASRWFELRLPPLLDAMLPAAALGQAVGRLGCFFAGCCFGTPSDGPLSVVFTDPVGHQLGGVPLGVHLHPVQLYDAAAHVVVFVVLLVLHRKNRMAGRLLPVWCLLEGVTRASLEAFRGDLGRGVWLGLPWLSTGRVTALAFICLAGVTWALLARGDKPLAAAPTSI